MKHVYNIYELHLVHALLEVTLGFVLNTPNHVQVDIRLKFCEKYNDVWQGGIFLDYLKSTFTCIRWVQLLPEFCGFHSSLRWRSQLMWRVFFTSAIVAVVVRTAMGWCKSGKCGHFGSGGFIIWDISGWRTETFTWLCLFFFFFFLIFRVDIYCKSLLAF